MTLALSPSLSPSPALLSLLRAVRNSPACPANLKSRLLNVLPSSDKTSDTPSSNLPNIPFDLLKDAWAIHKLESKNVYLHEIIQNSRIIAHSPPKPEKSPELLSILENIQARKSNLEYFDMLRTVLPNEHQSTLANSLKLSDTDLDRLSSPASSTPLPNLNSVNEAKAIFKTFTTIINVLFTVVSVFVAVFWISHHVSDDIALRTLVSFLAALLLAVAEGFLIYRATERDEKAAKTHVLHD